MWLFFAWACGSTDTFTLVAELQEAPDPAAIPMVRELTVADFPKTGVKVAEDGTLSWEAVSR